MSAWRMSRFASYPALFGLALLMFLLAAPAQARAQEDTETAVSDETLNAALEKAGENRAELQKALDTVPEAQRKAVRFLIAYMPADDLTALSAEYILKNVDYAFKAREATPWGKDIPEHVFFNDVLPYASINERRDDWRADFHERCLPMVKDCKTPGEAAQILNKELFPLLNVSYHATKRPKPNQSPFESMEASYASCSGLSVLLIDACRAVCVPTRFAGTASWTTKPGNHSWVEIWSDGGWHFTGACEYDPNGLDRGWFTGDAAAADGSDPRHAIWATSWKSTGDSFPMVWARRDRTVPGINVTGRYAPDTKETEIPEGKVLVSLEVYTVNGRERERISCDVTVFAGGESVANGKTTSSADDTNNRLAVLLTPETEYQIAIVNPAGETEKQSFKTSTDQRQTQRFILGEGKTDQEPISLMQDDQLPQTGEVASAAKAEVHSATLDALKAWLVQPRDDRPELATQDFATAKLTKEESAAAANLLWNDHAAYIRESRAAEMEHKEFSLGDKTLKFSYKIFGEKPVGGRSLFISLHGGGNARARVNDQQWENQKGLYKPEEGVYLAPRAPTNTWNLWHEGHIDPMFDHLIENMVVFEDVNPKRVYVMGYSAGGDGVYQIGPRMADRWAAAAMMAGHPNEAQPLNLRNIGFALHVGAEDGAYNRNQIAREWGEKLAKLHEEDPDGYVTQVQVHEGRAHWMNLEDAVAVPWMAQFTRNARPKQVVWYQDDITHSRFYWLVVDDEHKRGGTLIRASVQGQTIELKSDDVTAVTVLLDDELVNMDQPVTIRLNGETAFEGPVERTIAALATSLAERGDGSAMFPARVSVGK